MDIEKIDRYEIRGKLGKGGMAAVYRGYDPRFKREVAIKVMSQGLIGNDSSRARFSREAQVIASLEHPAIVPVYDFGEQDGHPFLVMRLMVGGTLGERLAQGPLTMTETYRIFERLAGALDAAHTRGIVHRDLKPANVLFDQWGEAYLADFGIVKVATEDASNLTGIGTTLGTPSYMSPEQAQGSETVDARSDIYALGVMLFETLTGRRPYEGTTPMAVALQHITAPVPELTQFNASLPFQTQAIIARAMAKDPQGRYQHASDMVSQLQQVALGSGEQQALPAPDVTQIADSGSTPPLTVPAVATGDSSGNPIASAAPPPSSKAGGRRISWPLLFAMGVVSLFVIIFAGGFLLSALRSPDPISTPTSQPIVAEIDTPEPAQPTVVTVAPSQEVVLDAPTPTVAPPTLVPLTPTASAPPYLPLGTVFETTAGPIQLDDAIQIGEVSQFGRGTAVSIAYAPGGSAFAVASSLGVYIYDSETRRERAFIPTAIRPFSVDITRDGETVAIGLLNNTIQIVNAASGEILHELTGHTSRVTDLAFSPDDTQLVSSSADLTVKLWRPQEAELLATLEGHTEIVRTVAFSANGKLIASAGDDRTVRVWDALSAELVIVMEGHTSPINSVEFAPNSQRLVTGSADQTVRVWQISNGVPLLTLREHTGPVNGVAYSPDGTTIVSVSNDRTVRLWNGIDGRLVSTLSGHTLNIVSVAYSTDGSTVASWALDGTVRFWRVSDGTQVGIIDDFTSPIYSLSLFMNQDTLAFGSIFKIGYWEYAGEQFIRMVDGAAGAVRSMDIAPADNLMVTASDDGVIYLWDVETGQLGQRLNVGGIINSVAFSPDGALIAVASSSGSVTLWLVSDLQESPLADDGDELTIRPVLELPGHAGGATEVAFSPSGAVLATASADGVVLLWDVVSGELQQRLNGHTDQVNAIAFSSDQQLIATAGADATIRVWEAESGLMLRILQGHRNGISDVTFSVDGTVLASAGADWLIKLWDPRSGSELTTLRGHRDSVNGVEFSHDGRFLASAASDGTVRLWAVNPE